MPPSRSSKSVCVVSPQAPQRHHLLLFLWVQDVPHGATDAHSVGARFTSRRRPHEMAGFEVSLNGRIWVFTEGSQPFDCVLGHDHDVECFASGVESTQARKRKVARLERRASARLRS